MFLIVSLGNPLFIWYELTTIVIFSFFGFALVKSRELKTRVMDKRYQVFVSSTYSDLQNERRKVLLTILSLDCIPTGMELFPAME